MHKTKTIVNKWRYLPVLVILPLVLTGCVSLNKPTSPAAPNGFVFRTTDKGVTWKQLATLVRPGAVIESLANTAVTTLTVDPTDPQTLYVGTPDRGLLYSNTSGADWRVTLENQGSIVAVAVDPANHCDLFVAIDQVIQKSIDCGRNWQRIVVVDGKTTNKIVSLAADENKAGRLYVGTFIGELMVSDNYGQDWKTINRFKSGVQKIILNPNDVNIIYGVTKSHGLWRSGDSGATWSDVTPHPAATDSKKLLGPLTVRLSLKTQFLITRSGTGYSTFRALACTGLMMAV